MDNIKAAKHSVARGARACTVCRAAKMKCVGADPDANDPCQRCKRSGTECVFEKHKRGRKPGSKLSEASKMLRRLEKGLNNAKLKSHVHETSLSQLAQDPRFFPTNDLPSLNLVPHYDGPHSHASVNGSDHEDEEDDSDKSPDGMYPAQLIKKANQRNSFFKTILNPENTDPHPGKGTAAPANGGSSSEHSSPFASARTPTRSPSAPPVNEPTGSHPIDLSRFYSQNGLEDPLSAGLLAETEVHVLWEMFFLRINPFINLFDPTLHTVNYVRTRSRFLFTAIVMACCKFFRPELYQTVKKLAHEFAIRAFAESWRRVEVVQAFACLTYWKEPEDTRTWLYIGYACRMAVELGLNHFVSESRLPTESELQWLERRNRERTYLVLWVHDRSLSAQTGRQWMLNEDELIRHSAHWHEQGGEVPPLERRPEDVILASFVQLRQIGSEIPIIFSARKHSENKEHKNDASYGELLKQCNYKLNQWMEHWEAEMTKAGSDRFHAAFIRLFWLYYCLFLNSFGLQEALTSAQPIRSQPDMEILMMCFRSGMEHLQSVVDDFAEMSTLRYGQDTITVMNAYCAVFLLKLLRNPNTAPHLPQDAVSDVHKCILRTANAYDGASDASNNSTSAANHAHFLKGLIARDLFHSKEQERLRQKRDNPVAGSSHGTSLATSSNSGPGSSFPETSATPQHPYPQYSQSSSYSMLPQQSGNIHPTSSVSPTSDFGPNVPHHHQPYSSYHASDPIPSSSNGHTSTFSYGPANHEPSQPHLTSNSITQSQADMYERLMYRNMGFDLYPPMGHQYAPTSQTRWMNDAGGPTAYATGGNGYAGGDYGYQQQRGYDVYQRG
ncbi:fungal-specific transcription factor domain-containing protein [Cristinia sonorae]|uniref:Fungal-specific transcription factor domain-containing protein n=1 Tax=Cristinia sonorae TaxID=1940300 RepID=A0A8K0URN1_9AGAR|nr:fungal-specific transcription factor domain-containing protein [Cristinia sonorae]